MRLNDLFDFIALIDDDLIEKTAVIEKKKKNIGWIKWCAVAACFALTAFTVVKFLKPDPNRKNIGPGGLPMLTIAYEADGMGFEGYQGYDISDIENQNPWTDDLQIKTLPVYKNTAYTDASGLTVSDISGEELEKRARSVAAALDLEVLKVSYSKVGKYNKPPYRPPGSTLDSNAIYEVNARCKEAEITVLANCDVRVEFTKTIKLPEDYNFTHDNISDEDAERVTSYLLERFSKLHSFTKPQKALSKNYDYYGNILRTYEVYDMSDDIEEKILNYNFRKIEFSPDSQGDLWRIDIHDILTCADKLGDYPVITIKEATELLLNGNYVTSVPEKMPGEKFIGKVELVYLTGNINETFLPYYRFLVELPNMQLDNGLKTYGAYYVPAVSKEYLLNMPIYDGSFN